MCEITFDEDCAVWKERNVKARKQHTCDSCCSVIQKGEAYIRHFSVYDGEPTTQKCCTLCDESRSIFEEEHDVYIVPSALTEMLSECVDSIDTEDPKRWQVMLDSILARRHPEVTSFVNG